MTTLAPATLSDLRRFPVPPLIWDAWVATWASPFAEQDVKVSKPVLMLGDDGQPFAVLGTSFLVSPRGALIPWVWAVPHAERRPTPGEIRRGIRLARRWLNENARGHVTVPQVVDDLTYIKLLRVVGFINHNTGVWSWPS
jgi:hypothetical protein